MGLISYFKKTRNRYLRKRVAGVDIPDFKTAPIVRKRLVFSGRVQRVGFRLETYEMGNRLGLVGWVKNRDDKAVEVEIQGKEEEIDFLIQHLKSLKRAKIKDVIVEVIPLVEDEEEFKVIL